MGDCPDDTWPLLRPPCLGLRRAPLRQGAARLWHLLAPLRGQSHQGHAGDAQARVGVARRRHLMGPRGPGLEPLRRPPPAPPPLRRRRGHGHARRARADAGVRGQRAGSGAGLWATRKWGRGGGAGVQRRAVSRLFAGRLALQPWRPRACAAGGDAGHPRPPLAARFGEHAHDRGQSPLCHCDCWAEV